MFSLLLQVQSLDTLGLVIFGLEVVLIILAIAGGAPKPSKNANISKSFQISGRLDWNIRYMIPMICLTLTAILADKRSNLSVFYLWIIQIGRRIYEVNFVHIYSSPGKVPDTIAGAIFVTLLTFGCSYPYLTFKDTSNEVGRMIGSIVFAIGIVGNTYCHRRLRNLRLTLKNDSKFVKLVKKSDGKERKYVLPHGNVFDYVYCAISLGKKALDQKKWYIKTFNIEKKDERKAIVLFIL